MVGSPLIGSDTAAAANPSQGRPGSVSDAMALPSDHPSHRLRDSAYLRACRRETVPHTPVWFQRQAGRSLPEYLAIRGDGSILDAIHDPELSAEITLQPIRRYGVDAAILFSDIVVPADAVGFDIDVVPGVGPVARLTCRWATRLNPGWRRLRHMLPALRSQKTPMVMRKKSMVYI